jgi:hypothetical protein
MKKSYTANIFYSIYIFILGFISFGCNQPLPEQKEDANALSIEKERKNITPSLSEKNQIITIQNQEKEEYLRLDLGNREAVAVINQAQEQVTGDFTNPQKIKYFDQRGDVTAFVKVIENELILKNTDNQLLWKVRANENEIRIGNTEDLKLAFSIKAPNVGKIRVFNVEKLLGEIYRQDTLTVIKGFKVYHTKDLKLQGVLGTLLINEIPENLKMVIFTELLRNKITKF